MDGFVDIGINAAAATTSEPLTYDVLLDAIANVYGELSPDRRDEARLLAVEARADAFIRTLDEIRDL